MQDSSVRHMVMRKHNSWDMPNGLVWDIYGIYVEIGYAGQFCLAHGFEEVL